MTGFGYRKYQCTICFILKWRLICANRISSPSYLVEVNQHFVIPFQWQGSDCLGNFDGIAFLLATRGPGTPARQRPGWGAGVPGPWKRASGLCGALGSCCLWDGLLLILMPPEFNWDTVVFQKVHVSACLVVWE